MLQLLNATAIPALEQTAIFAQRRHEVLAGNLANLDTPDYRARDLSIDSFQNALAESIQHAQHPPEIPSRASMGTSSPAVQRSFADGPRHAMEQIVFHDNSDVGLESQVTEMAKNQHLHNMVIALFRNQVSLLRTAISESA